MIYAIKAYNSINSQGGGDRLVAAGYLDNIAKIYDILGDFENALINHNLCLRIIKKTVGDKNSRYGRTLRNIAKICRKLNYHDLALDFESQAKIIGY